MKSEKFEREINSKGELDKLMTSSTGKQKVLVENVGCTFWKLSGYTEIQQL